MNCKTLDPLVTPYVDGELDAANRAELDAHLRVCPPCPTRVAAEQTVRELLQTRQSALQQEHASAAPRAKCAALTRAEPRCSSPSSPARVRGWLARLLP